MATHYVVLGHFGSDAGYWYIGADGKLHHVPGWSPEQLAEVSRAVELIGQAAALKTPGLAERVTGALTDFVQKELTGHVKDSGAGGISVVSLGG